MSQESDGSAYTFDEAYFKSGAYEKVSFARITQYWWSNRFYAHLAQRYGPKQGRVLEAGCGLGHLLSWLSSRYSVFGTDINAWALSQARRNVPRGKFALTSAENLGAFPRFSFQILIAMHVVEHLPHPEQAIAEMSRVLCPGWLLLMATPNLDSPMLGVKKRHWIGYKDETHISLKRPCEWLAALEMNGFRLRKAFSDGFWDSPYIPVIPVSIQKIVFGALGGLQAILGWGIIPLRMGENLIVLANRV
jgi:SAM-dependent methyltransferase